MAILTTSTTAAQEASRVEAEKRAAFVAMRNEERRLRDTSAAPLSTPANERVPGILNTRDGFTGPIGSSGYMDLAEGPVPEIDRVRVEEVEGSENYMQDMGRYTSEKNLTPAQLEKINQEGGYKNIGTDVSVYDGKNEDGQNQFKEVTKSMFEEDAARTALPDPAGILDIEKLSDEKIYGNSFALVNTDSADKASGQLYDMIDYLSQATNPEATGELAKSRGYNQSFSESVGKINLDKETLANIFVLSNAGALKTQSSYVRGKVTGAYSITSGDMESYGFEYMGKKDESQVGLTTEGMVATIAGRLKRLLSLAKVDQSSIEPRDYQEMASGLLQQTFNSGQMNRTVINGRQTLAPRGNHLGDLLGTQSDVLVGANIENAVQKVPGAMASSNTLEGTTPGREGKKSPSGKNAPVQPSVDAAKDIMGHMAFGIDLDLMTSTYIQVSDMLQKLVVGNTSTDPNNSEQLTHSTSAFASEFNMDLEHSKAEYLGKVIAARAEGVQEKSRIAHDQNKITNTRMDEMLKNLNKQLKLLKEGKFAEANEAFYYTFGNGDINGRIYNTTNNGNYTLDKQFARQIQKAKINPRVTVLPAGLSFDLRNKTINNTAKDLFNAEGNPEAFNKIADRMPAHTEAEISFRVAQVITILKDAKHARKEAGKGISTPHGDQAIQLANATGLTGLSNISMKALYDGYLAVNSGSNSLLLTSHFASQGAELRTSLDNINNTVMSLEVIPFDINSSARERTEQALSAWGDIKTSDLGPLERYANQRGEMRQQMSIRDNALKYMNAHNKVVDEITGLEANPNVELDFEIELDATQSGPMLQALIAPGITASDTRDALGYRTNNTGGDLRDKGKDMLLNGSVVSTVFTGDPESGHRWQKIISNSLKGDRAGVGRELLLKQTIMQYYYGKPAGMFGDIAEEFLGYFNEDIDADTLLKTLSATERVDAVKLIIAGMLEHPTFDNNYIDTMKNLGRHLALTGSDLILDGPAGPINLTMESLQQAFIDSYNEDGTPSALELDIIEIFDQNEEAFKFSVTNKTTNSYASKPGNFNPTKPTSGANYQSSPGRRLADSIGVLIVHQLDNAAMNHTINIVNKNRGRNNPLPAKVIYDAVITNAAGLLRYSHAYNNESIPMIEKWNFGKSLDKLMKKAASDFELKTRDVENFNISVIEGQDGNLHGVDRYSVLTTWMDQYYHNMPNPNELKYKNNQSLYLKKKAEYANSGIESFVKASKASNESIKPGEANGYLPPIYNPDYLENGVIGSEDVLILNASERANMTLNRDEFRTLFKLFTQKHKGMLDTFIKDIENNKAKLRELGITQIAHLTGG